MERLFNCKNVTHIGLLLDETYGPIPLFEIRELSREEWNKLAASKPGRTKEGGANNEDAVYD